MSDESGRPEAGAGQGPSSPDGPASEPRSNWLRRIIGRGPEARKRLGEAVGSLLGTTLIALAAIVALVVWHLARRGRIIRERLEPPRDVRLPDPEDLRGAERDDPVDDLSTS